MPKPRKMAAQFGQQLSNPAMTWRADSKRMMRDVRRDWSALYYSFGRTAEVSARAARGFTHLRDIMGAMLRGVQVTIVDSKARQLEHAARVRQLYPNVITYRPTAQDPNPQEFPCR